MSPPSKWAHAEHFSNGTSAPEAVVVPVPTAPFPSPSGGEDHDDDDEARPSRPRVVAHRAADDELAAELLEEVELARVAVFGEDAVVPAPAAHLLPPSGTLPSAKSPRAEAITSH